MKIFAMLISAALCAAAFAQESSTPAPAPQVPVQPVCSTVGDQLLVAEWNSANVFLVCPDLSGQPVATPVAYAPGTQQIVAYNGDNFFAYSTSGRLRWVAPGYYGEWMVPAGGLLSSGKNGLVLTERWEHSKGRLYLYAEGHYYYEKQSFGGELTDFCTAVAGQPGGLQACSDMQDQSLTVYQPVLGGMSVKPVRFAFGQLAVGAAYANQKLYVLLATQTEYPAVPVGSTGPVFPSKILPGRLMEFSISGGKVVVNELETGLDIIPSTNTQRVSAVGGNLYFMTGSSRIMKYDTVSNKLAEFYNFGENKFIGAITAVPRY